MTLSMFVVGLDFWLSSGAGEGHMNHTDVLSSHTDDFGDLDIEVHGHVDYDGFDDSEAMEELLQNAPHCKLSMGAMGANLACRGD